MNRTQRILSVVLVLQIALAAVALWPRGAQTGKVEPLLGGTQTADVVAMTVSDNAGQSVTLRQVTGNWVLPAADDYPAQGERITAALDKLVALDTRRLVTRTSGSHKRLQVAADDFVRRVELETASGQKQVLYLGSAPSYGATHVRVDGRDDTYLVSNISSWDLGTAATSWVDTSYLSVAQDQVAGMTVVNGQGTLTFVKEAAATEGAEASWTLAGVPQGETLTTETVRLAVDRATAVTMVAPLGKERKPEYGMDTPLATVTLQKADGTPVTLLVGAKDASDGSYVVKASTSPYFVRVSEYNVTALVEYGIGDFLQAKPTPTAGS